MKLISMTDFVLEYVPESEIEDSRLLDMVLNYTTFLKQPLALWMFIACDEDNEVMPMPGSAPIYTHPKEYILEYQKAKERCLFQGFFVSEDKDTKPTDIKSITNGIIHAYWYNNVELWYKSRGITIVEDLVRYNLTLSQTAIKQLGL